MLAIAGLEKVTERFMHRELLIDRLQWMPSEEGDPDAAALMATGSLVEAGFAPYPMDAEEMMAWIRATDDLPAMATARLPLRPAEDQAAALMRLRETTLDAWAASQAEPDPER